MCTSLAERPGGERRHPRNISETLLGHGYPAKHLSGRIVSSLLP